MRIVSLLPASTEIAFRLGAAADLVGRSHECDFPAEVRRLPAVSRPRLDPSRPGRDIHDSVQSLLQAALSIYELDLALLTRLSPDVILTQDQCAVCAVPASDVRDAARRALARPVEIVSCSPLRLADVRDDFRRIGAALARDPEPLVADFDRCLDLVSRMQRPSPPPRVLGLEWLDPPMAAGNWFAELVRIAGGSPAVPPTSRTERISWEAIDASRPDLTVVVPCGFDLPRAQAELKRLARPLPGRVCVVDGNAYVNRPGPRLVTSAEILAQAIRGEPDRAPDWAWV